MGNFSKQIKKGFKDIRRENFSDDQKKELKMNSVKEILDDISNKKNRYIFYCPDITVVNPLVKLIYEVALQVKKAGYNVVILHEINGFKAHWLYSSEDYSEYKSLHLEYIINKVSAKSKKKQNTYAFRASDTLVVADAYQDMLDNIMAEEALRLVQKIVMVTGYMGLSSIQPGMDYVKLGVSSLIFFDNNIRNDYNELFPMSSYMVDNYPISVGFNRNVVRSNHVYPVIGLTAIGNNDKANQLINIFYNRYPNLSMFTFKIVARDNMTEFIDNIATSAAMVIMDKNVVTKQMIYECLNMGVPVILPQRREFMDNKTIIENYVVEDDAFTMCDMIANYCQYWLTSSTADIKNSTTSVADELGLHERTMEDFGNTVTSIFDELHSNRNKTFSNLEEMIKNS